MRKIFYSIVLIFLVCFTNNVSAQFVPFQSGQFKRLAADTLYDFTGCDTPTVSPNSYRRVVRYYDSCNHINWHWQPELQEWAVSGGGSGGSGDSTLFAKSGTRIANGDVTGDLDGHYLITQNGNIAHVLPNANEFRVLNNASEWLQISPVAKNSFMRALNDSGITSQILAAGYNDFPGFTATTSEGATQYVTVEGSLRHGFTHFAAKDATGDTLTQTDMFLYAKQNGIFKAAGFEILSQRGDPYIHVIGNTEAQTITFDANNIFPRNGAPASGKVPTGTDGLGNWTWQPGGGGSGDTTLTWEQTLNNQGAIPFAVAHNTDLNDNNFTLSNSDNFTVQSNSGNSPNSLLQTTPTNGQIYVAGDSTEAGVLVQNNNTQSTTVVQLRANKTTEDKSHIITVNPDSIHISGTSELNLRVRGLPYGNDTSSIKPMVVGTDGKVYRSSWYGVGGGLGARDTAYLLQGYGTLINNLEGYYKPNGSDVLIAVDTSVIATKQDITIITNSDTAIFIVDSISNAPPAGAVDGNDYLVGTSPTGLFAGHANEIAELVGGVYTFTVPTAQQQLIVDNAVTYATYQFNGTIWVQTSILWRVNGNRSLGLNAWMGRFDKQRVSFRSWNKVFMYGDTTRDVYLPKFIGTPSFNYLRIDSVTGRIDTGMFRPLIAGANIAITPGPVGDTISSTSSGGSSLSAPAGYTLHGTGTGVYQDTIIYKDTAKNWVAINRTMPLGVFSVFATFPGTVSTTSGSPTVTGTGTRFQDNFSPGSAIIINGTPATVLSIVSQTSLTLSANFGSTLTNVGYSNENPATSLFTIRENGDFNANGNVIARIMSVNNLRNTSFGSGAMAGITIGNNNTAFGYEALQSNTEGQNNTAIGRNALKLNSSGTGSNAFGFNALSNNTTGPANTAVGYASLFTNSTGAWNVAIGTGSLYANTTGYYNVAIGTNTLDDNQGGAFNTAIGVQALDYNASGNSNIALGYTSLRFLGEGGVTKDNNIALGYGAAAYLADAATHATSMSNSIFIGSTAYPLGNTDVNEIVIGHDGRGNGSNSTTLGNSSTTDTWFAGSTKLHVTLGTAPASATATGVAGTVIITTDYIYVCTATDTWKRTAISTW